MARGARKKANPKSHLEKGTIAHLPAVVNLLMWGGVKNLAGMAEAFLRSGQGRRPYFTNDEPRMASGKDHISRGRFASHVNAVTTTKRGPIIGEGASTAALAATWGAIPGDSESDAMAKNVRYIKGECEIGNHGVWWDRIIVLYFMIKCYRK